MRGPCCLAHVACCPKTRGKDMRINDSAEEAAWREEVQDFLKNELPEAIRRRRGAPFAEIDPTEPVVENPSTEPRPGGAGFRLPSGPMGEWRKKLADRGW